MAATAYTDEVWDELYNRHGFTSGEATYAVENLLDPEETDPAAEVADWLASELDQLKTTGWVAEEPDNDRYDDYNTYEK